MSAQQIKLNIHELVNGFEDESLLDEFYRALNKIAKSYQQDVIKFKDKPLDKKQSKTSQKAVFKNNISTEIKSINGIESTEEKSIPHDLSLVFLANELFKGSQPLPEAGEIAFEKAFKKSLLKEPTLPNRL